MWSRAEGNDKTATVRTRPPDGSESPDWRFDEEEVKLELDTIIERLIISRLSKLKMT